MKVPVFCKMCNKESLEYPSNAKRKKFCSHSCRNKFCLTGIKMTEESRLKMSLSRKGSVPWNKGIKTGITSEKIKMLASFRWMGDKNPRRINPPKKEKHPNWINDRTLLKKDDRRNDSLYKEWRKNIYKRDNYKCRIADSNCGGRLEAHHILSWKDFPELRYEINNGITLCHAHHPKVRAEEKRLIPTFQELVSVSKQ